MEVSKVLAELRKTRQLVVEAIATVERLTQRRGVQRWVTASTKAGRGRAALEMPAWKHSAAKGQ